MTRARRAAMLVAAATTITTLAWTCARQGIRPSGDAADARLVVLQDTQKADTALAAGDSVYHAWCDDCHALYPPESKPASTWFSTVRKMRDIARAMGHDTLTHWEIFAVTDYLEAHASGPAESDGPGRGRI